MMDALLKLTAQMAREGIRRLLVLSGDESWTLQQAQALRERLGGDGLWVGPEPVSAPCVAPGALKTLLGREVMHAFFDARRGFDVAAMAATSNPRRASKKACITSRPSSVFSAPGATQGAETGSGPTHRPSPPSLSRSACACCSVQLSSPLSTSRRRIPSRAICAVSLSSASIMGDDYSALPKVLHCAGSPLSKPRLNQV